MEDHRGTSTGFVSEVVEKRLGIRGDEELTSREVLTEGGENLGSVRIDERLALKGEFDTEFLEPRVHLGSDLLGESGCEIAVGTVVLTVEITDTTEGTTERTVLGHLDLGAPRFRDRSRRERHWRRFTVQV
jgi:hypothetical protein